MDNDEFFCPECKARLGYQKTCPFCYQTGILYNPSYEYVEETDNFRPKKKVEKEEEEGAWQILDQGLFKAIVDRGVQLSAIPLDVPNPDTPSTWEDDPEPSYYAIALINRQRLTVGCFLTTPADFRLNTLTVVRCLIMNIHGLTPAIRAFDPAVTSRQAAELARYLPLLLGQKGWNAAVDQLLEQIT